jgi:ATP-dependent Lon protease
LPGSTLFPYSVLPLQILEAPYQRMVHDCLESHRMFCVGTLREQEDKKDHQSSIYEVLGVGLIRFAFQNPDGTAHVLLQGLSRARITGLVFDRPYLCARIEELETHQEDNLTIDALAAKVSELALIRGKMSPNIPPETVKYLTKLQDPGTLSDLISFTLLDDYHDRQSVLETLDVQQRLRMVVTLLQRDITKLQTLENLQEVMKKLKHKSHWN